MSNGCTIFVGNIDFDIPEEKIVKELSAVGKIVNFRMMYDRTTERSKGYGFAEYENSIIAETAVQTLRFSFNGRPVKINYAGNDTPVRPKIEVKENIDVEDIAKVIKNMEEENLKKVILFLKRMAIDQPEKLKSILNDNKQLVVALFECLLKLGLINPNVIDSLIKDSVDLNESKSQIVNRLMKMSEEDLMKYPENVRHRIQKIRGHGISN